MPKACSPPTLVAGFGTLLATTAAGVNGCHFPPTKVSTCPSAGAVASTSQIGRENVCTPVTVRNLVCRLLLEKKTKKMLAPYRRRGRTDHTLRAHSHSTS